MELNDDRRFYKFSVLFPMETTCPICGFEVELWNSGDEAKCRFCGYKIFHKENILH